MRGESSGNMHREAKVGEATIRRLSNYHRILDELQRDGVVNVSSEGLAERYGTTSAQVRKDFSSFGSFGRRGRGYEVPELRKQIGAILGIDVEWKQVLVGAGYLGHALFHYGEFRRQGFHISAIFDNDPEKVGSDWDGVQIHGMDELERIVAEKEARIGVIAVPGESGQEVADRLVAAGIEGILNFAPVKLTSPDNVYIRNVNLAIAMESLTYSLSKKLKLRPF